MFTICNVYLLCHLLGDAVAQMELQPAGGFHPYILRLLNYRLSQSTVTLTCISQTITEQPPNISLSRT